MLIIFAGLPGTGKTTIAQELARRLGAVHLRIDSIEQALRTFLVDGRSMDDAGYRVAYEVAADNLRIGRTVVADSVNPIPLTRDAWHSVSQRVGVEAVEIEIVCSDINEHRRRVESRVSEIRGLKLPTWQDVVDREYSATWSRDRHLIDTAGRTADECVDRICSLLGRSTSSTSVVQAQSSETR